MEQKPLQTRDTDIYLEPTIELIQPPTLARPIEKAVVVGAGTMGSGIAAQLANAGVKVHLLDIVPDGAEDRDILAKAAIERMLKASPATDPLNAGFMTPESARRITPGNSEDHLAEAVRDADWIVEVVLEDLAVKRALFERLDSLRKPTAIVSSNTSTIPLADLVEGRSLAFKKHFVITHFFNPPRFMHLLEVVGSPDTEPDVLDTICRFGDARLGKNVIVCKDTPAFLANRIGIYFMFRAINEAIDRGMKIEEVDAVLGRPIGFPKDGIFGLVDLVGVGIVPLVTKSMLEVLPEGDHFHEFDHQKGLTLVAELLKDGRLGRKSPKGGFYRMHKREDGSKQKQAIDLKTGEYYDIGKVRLKSASAAKKHGPRAVLEGPDELSRFAWEVVRDTLLYAAWLIPEIGEDVADLDAALRGGYNAQWGPFEIIDRLGVDWFSQRVVADGQALPPVLKIAAGRSFYQECDGKPCRLMFDFENQRAEYVELSRPAGVLCLDDVKRNSQPLLSHHSARLWDLGDGVTGLELTSKMNTLDPSVLWTVHRSIEFIKSSQGRYQALVLYNDAENYSFGANLGLIQAGFVAADSRWASMLGLSRVLENAMYPLVESLIYHGQSVFHALRHAPFPVVGAPRGMALGGGCEILLHCDAIQASAETYMGLVESGVGVIPGWGGCMRYLERCMKVPGLKGGTAPPVHAAFKAILMPQMSVSTSGADARNKFWLREGDGITMNPDRLLADAKAKALSLVEGYAPPQPVTFRLPGPAGKAALRMAVDDFYTKGDATWHDVLVADALADVLTGGDTHAGATLSESDLAQLEREHFLSLVKTAQTKKRIAHTLKTGKPLREAPLEDEKSLDELRAMRAHEPLKPRPLAPIQGAEALRLRVMAEVTALLLKAVT